MLGRILGIVTVVFVGVVGSPAQAQTTGGEPTTPTGPPASPASTASAAPEPPPPPPPTSPPPAQAATPEVNGCTRDTDCKGDRVCDHAQCVAPPTTQASPVQSGAAPAAVSAPSEGGKPSAPPKHDFFYLSVERTFGFSYWKTSKQKNGAADGNTDGASLSLFTGTTSPDAFPATAYQVPRVAFDFAVYRGLTIGGAATLFFSESEEVDTSNQSKGKPNLLLLEFDPRVGYQFDVASWFSLWPRAGLTLFGFSETSKDSKGNKITTSTSGSAFTFEGMAVIRPIPHWGLVGGVTADIGLAGSAKTTPSTSTDTRTFQSTAIGVSGGGVVSF